MAMQALYHRLKNFWRAIYPGQYVYDADQRLLIMMWLQKQGLAAQKICFDALTNNQIDLYPEYTGTGLLPILQPSAKTVDSLLNNKDKTYDYVQRDLRRNIISNG